MFVVYLPTFYQVHIKQPFFLSTLSEHGVLYNYTIPLRGGFRKKNYATKIFGISKVELVVIKHTISIDFLDGSYFNDTFITKLMLKGT